jgi:flagellar basal body rod protein FlgG
MIKGMHTSATGMIPRVKKQELIANNVANAGTPGFKKDASFTRELTRAELKTAPKANDWQKPLADKVYVDFTPGVFDRTDNLLDMAIDGEGFFTLQDAEGNNYLTRSGSFTVNNNGQLSFGGSFLVTGEGGPIQIGDGRVSVSLSGEVQSDGVTVGRIVPMTVNDVSRLTKIGGSMFAVPRDEELIPAINPTIRQGYLEAANVDIVHEMVNMMASFRSFEANAKALQTQDSSLEHLFRRVAGGS